MDDPAAKLCETGSLQRSLERQAAVARLGSVAVAFVCGSAAATASVNGTSERAAPIGCVAKVLTATLVSSSVERGLLTLDASAAESLRDHGVALRGVTVRHLLEHAHGLDDSLLASPRCRHGFIDVDDLLARVAALPRWAPAGTAYSYGNAGAWLLAAVLERLHGRAFRALVRDEVLAPLGVEGVWLGGAPPCPATGAGLALTAEELARFGLHALATNRCIATAPIAPLPGWHPLERGICLGWKSAGAAWFGHQSAWPGASIYLRVQPQRKLALAVVAREQPAAVVALGVFGRHFPELFDGRMRLPSDKSLTGDDDLPLGAYAQAARVVVVAATPVGLSAEAWERDERGAQRGVRARAALVRVGGVLFAQPASELMPYLEVISGANGATWLWNGRCILRRVD